MENEMKKQPKQSNKMSSGREYAKSMLITFVSAFAIAVIPFLGDATIEQGAMVSIIMTGGRAGIKAIFEYFSILKV